mmetsp:Transcript_38988/g.103003  ORF Transcript_38988/g.103003 Transcript_38988/m.103003 type:complete len:257 (+) Transcript_38988:1005-1775(+)
MEQQKDRSEGWLRPHFQLRHPSPKVPFQQSTESRSWSLDGPNPRALRLTHTYTSPVQEAEHEYRCPAKTTPQFDPYSQHPRRRQAHGPCLVSRVPRGLSGHRAAGPDWDILGERPTRPLHRPSLRLANHSGQIPLRVLQRRLEMESRRGLAVLLCEQAPTYCAVALCTCRVDHGQAANTTACREGCQHAERRPVRHTRMGGPSAPTAEQRQKKTHEIRPRSCSTLTQPAAQNSSLRNAAQSPYGQTSLSSHRRYQA